MAKNKVESWMSKFRTWGEGKTYFGFKQGNSRTDGLPWPRFFHVRARACGSVNSCDPARWPSTKLDRARTGPANGGNLCASAGYRQIKAERMQALWRRTGIRHQSQEQGRSDRSGETNGTAMRASGARALQWRVGECLANAMGLCVCVCVCVCVSMYLALEMGGKEAAAGGIYSGDAAGRNRERTEGRRCGRRGRGASPGLWRRQALCPRPCSCRVADADVADSMGRRLLAAPLWPKMPRHPWPLLLTPVSFFLSPISFPIDRSRWLDFGTGWISTQRNFPIKYFWKLPQTACKLQ
jgi:hypothetical protein